MRDFKIFLPQKSLLENIVLIVFGIYMVCVFVTAWPTIRSSRTFYIPIIFGGAIILLGIILIIVAKVFPSLG